MVVTFVSSYFFDLWWYLPLIWNLGLFESLFNNYYHLLWDFTESRPDVFELWIGIPDIRRWSLVADHSYRFAVTTNLLSSPYYGVEFQLCRHCFITVSGNIQTKFLKSGSLSVSILTNDFNIKTNWYFVSNLIQKVLDTVFCIKEAILLRSFR